MFPAVHARSHRAKEISAESTGVDVALRAWRYRTANGLLVASATVHLPAMVLAVLGYGPSLTPPVLAICLAAYLVMLAAAVARGIETRARLWAYFVAAYVIVGLANLLTPTGPYAHLGLVANPVLVLVLLGSRAGWIAAVTSVAVLLSATYVRHVPEVARAALMESARATSPQDVAWFQFFAVTAFLIVLMILLDKFHRFLVAALAAQYDAKMALEREAAGRAAAQRKVEQERRDRQRVEREIAAVTDEERRRLGAELHDGVCQQLTATLLRCQALQRSVQQGGTVSGAAFDPITSLLAETIDDAHNVALGLCPLEQGPEALAASLRGLAGRTREIAGVRCEFFATGDTGVATPETAQHLYRIAQEAMSNAARHAQASRITVELRGSAGELTLQVEDDGVGLSADRQAGGVGLRTMRYRAEILGGELTVAPVPGGGTRVCCRVPRAMTPRRAHGAAEERPRVST